MVHGVVYEVVVYEVMVHEMVVDEMVYVVVEKKEEILLEKEVMALDYMVLVVVKKYIY